MLFIDPATCVDCGACVSACPVDAIKPRIAAGPEELAFLDINAAFYHATPRAAAAGARCRRGCSSATRGEPTCDVAIVGSGSRGDVRGRGGADDSRRAGDGVRAARPAVRARAHRRRARSPAHAPRDAASSTASAAHPRLTMHLGVEIGRDLTHEQLLERHHAVIYAVGAASDRRLEIPGADLPGVRPATELVGWYNGHPDFGRHRPFDLSHRRAVVIGNGNVALDVARILTVDPETLVDTEIAPRALEALRHSRVEEVVVDRTPRARALVVHAARARSGYSATGGHHVRVDPADLIADAPAGPSSTCCAGSDPADGGRAARIHLRYGLTPQRVVGDGHVDGRGVRADSGGGRRRDHRQPGVVLTAIGYRGEPVPALPFDPVHGHRPQRRRPRRRSGDRRTGPGHLRRRLDQTRTDRLHRNEQALRPGDRGRSSSTTTTRGCCVRSHFDGDLPRHVRVDRAQVIDRARRRCARRCRRCAR